MAKARPLLLYHGAKFRIATWVISHFPAHRVYVEPYGGAGAVLLRKEPAEVEVWNDLNDDLFNLFLVLRTPSQAAELLSRLAITPYARREQELAFEPCSDPVERARRLIVRAFFTVGSDAASRGRRSGFRAYSDITTIGAAPVLWAINKLILFP